MSYNPQNPNGQAASANSSPVVIASDQSVVPVSVSGVSTSAHQTDGSQKAQIVDGSGNVVGSTSNALDVNIKSGGTSSVSATDEAAWTAGTSAFVPVGGVYNDSAAALTAGQEGTTRVTGSRALHANIRNASGTELATLSNPLRIDPTGTTTQPVSGTVTTTPPSHASTNVDQINGTTTDTNSGNKSAGTQRVVIATDQPQLTNALKVDGSGVTQPVSGTVTADTELTTADLDTGAGTDTKAVVGLLGQASGGGQVIGSTSNALDINIKSGNPSSITANAGTNLNTSALALETGGNLATLAGAVTSSKVQANVAQINGNTTSTAASGTQKVGIVGSAGAAVDAATNAAPPANAIQIGGVAATALPSAYTATDLAPPMLDKFGRQVVLHGTVRDLVGTQTTTIAASTSETTIVTAGVSGVFNDITLLIVSNTSATATRVDFRDTTAGTILFSMYIPAGDVRGFSLGGATIPQTSAATNWTAQSSTSVTDLRIYAVFQKNK